MGARRVWVVVLSAAAVLLEGCSDDGGVRSAATTTARPTTTAAAGPLTYDQLAERLECTDFPAMAEPERPIGVGAATRGMWCDIGGTRVHVFEREGAVGPTGSASGTVERIDESLQTGTVTDGCSIVRAITEHYFIVAPSQRVLDQLAPITEPTIVPSAPASPTVSYLTATCNLDLIGMG